MNRPNQTFGANILCIALVTLVASSMALAVAQEAQAYVVKLQPVNSELTQGAAQGLGVLVSSGGELNVAMTMRTVPPGIMHLQHFHGFVGDQDAVCPTSDADANGDGIVDLIEATEVGGRTLIPLNGDPANLIILSETYPIADDMGSYVYTATIDLSELQSAIEETYGISSLDLERRTIFVHSVPQATDLPHSVQSLPDVPAHLTVPIACGVVLPAGNE